MFLRLWFRAAGHRDIERRYLAARCGVLYSEPHIVKGEKCFMKKWLCLALCLMISFCAFAQNNSEKVNLSINRNAILNDFEGDWVLKSTYAIDTMKADAVYLSLELFKLSTYDWATYTNVEIIQLEGSMQIVKGKESIDYECVVDGQWFGSDLGGTGYIDIYELDGDFPFLELIALNNAGELILGYSDGSIAADKNAVFAYAFIFELVK